MNTVSNSLDINSYKNVNNNDHKNKNCDSNFKKLYKNKIVNKLNESENKRNSTSENKKDEKLNNNTLGFFQKLIKKDLDNVIKDKIIQILNQKDEKRISFKDNHFETFTNNMNHQNEENMLKHQKKIYYDILGNMQKEKFHFSFHKISNQEVQNLISINSKFYFEKRKNIVQIILQLNHKLRFNKESIFLAIHFMDIIANILCTDHLINFEKLDFKKITIACTLLSSKFSENDPNIPNIKDYNLKNVNNYYDTQTELVNEIKKLEVDCLILLNHKLNYSTPFNFLKFFFIIGFFFEEDLENYRLFEKLKNGSSSDKDNQYDNESFYQAINDSYQFCDEILLRIFQENDIFFHKNEFDSFRLVCSIICLSRENFYQKLATNKKVNTIDYKNLRMINIWPKKMKIIYNIGFEEFKEEYNINKKLCNNPIKIFLFHSIKERKIKIQTCKNEDINSLNKNNSRPQSTINSKLSNILFLQNQEMFKENVMTVPNKYEEKKLSVLKSSKHYYKNINSDLNLHINYHGNTFTDVNEKNSSNNKLSNNKKEIFDNDSYSYKKQQEKIQFVKNSFSDNKQDLKGSHSSYSRINIQNKIDDVKIKNIAKIKDQSESLINNVKNINFEKNSKYESNNFSDDYLAILTSSFNNNIKKRKKSQDTSNISPSKKYAKFNKIIEKNISYNENNYQLHNNLEKYLKNELDLNFINIANLRSSTKPKGKITENPDEVQIPHIDNKEEINILLRDINDRDCTKIDNKSSGKNIIKEKEAFYTKLSDYKTKIISERNIKNLDEKINPKIKTNFNFNRFYAANNTLENNTIKFNEFHDKFSNSVYNEQIKNKNLLDKTKNILNKNSIELLDQPSNDYNREKINDLKKIFNDNFHVNPYKYRKERQIENIQEKNSIIITNNNTNINSIFGNKNRSNFPLEKKYDINFNNYHNKYYYRNDRDDIEKLQTNKKDLYSRRHELDYNYVTDWKNITENRDKKELINKNNYLDSSYSNNFHNPNTRDNVIFNNGKYNQLKSKINLMYDHYGSSDYKKNLNYLSNDKTNNYFYDSKYYSYIGNQMRDNYINY